MAVVVARQEAAAVLRRVGLADLAAELEKKFPEEIDKDELNRFADEHGVTRELLTDRMGGSP